MRSGRMRRPLVAGMMLALASAGAVAVVALTPTPAAAAGNWEREVSSWGVSAFDSTPYKSLRVNCPNGKVAVSANYFVEGASGKIVLDDLIMDVSGVTVGAGEIVGVGEAPDGTPENWRIRASAVCVRGRNGMRWVHATSGPAVTSSQWAAASCASGEDVIGVGSSLSQGFGQVSMTNRWVSATSVTAFAHVDEDGFSGAWSVTAYAVCYSPPSGYEIVRGPTEPSTVSISSSGLCPGGKVILGVGWEQTGGGEVFVYFVKADSTFIAATVPDEDGVNFVWYTSATAICIDP